MIKSPTNDAAISAALAQDWREAIRINIQLIKLDKTNIDTLNRLGFAYMQTGQLTSAKRVYKRALTIDPYNQIALKNSKKLSSVKPNIKHKNAKKHNISPLLFLEEPGRTKIAPCVNPAPTQTLSTLTPGQEVFLKEKKHCIEIRNSENTYLGALPDDLSYKLIKLLHAGNTYHVIVKNAQKNSLVVMLRERTRGKRFTSQPSFIAPPPSGYVSFSRSLASESDRPDVTPTGEIVDEEDKSEDKGHSE